MESFTKLAQFFLKHREVAYSPYSNLKIVWRIFQTEIGNGNFSYQEFVNEIKMFNKTVCLVEFNRPIDVLNFFGDISITFVDYDRIEQLQRSLIGNEKKSFSSADSETVNSNDLISLDYRGSELINLLNEPIRSPYMNVQALLLSPLASHSLMKMKIRLKTNEKPFFEVCEDSNHVKSLSNLKPSSNELTTELLEKIKKKNSSIYQCCLTKIHYVPRIMPFTDMSIGDCSYLDTCHRMKSCRYLHYYTLNPPSTPKTSQLTSNKIDKVGKLNKKLIELMGFDYFVGDDILGYNRQLLPAQWINCDLRDIPFPILGKFAAIISDPAWDIHMSLPYGSCKDTELLQLPINQLQDEGIMLLWVTGRSIETGRKALKSWGYEVSDELIWVKLNQLRRTIVTGRTGHWLNHSKEHLLVGVKGKPLWLNRLVDSTLIASPTRETSRKPDEVYDIVERIVGKYSRKLELFGREHNIREGWFTIGNQLPQTSIYEMQVKNEYEKYLASK